METKFGMWLKSKGFARLFPVIVVAAMGYLGLRIATALRWGGLHWYLPVFVLMLLLVVYAPVVRAWLVLAAAGISALLLIYGSVHARRLKTASLPGGAGPSGRESWIWKRCAPLEDILRNADSGKPTIVLDHAPPGHPGGRFLRRGPGPLRPYA